MSVRCFTRFSQGPRGAYFIVSYRQQFIWWSSHPVGVQLKKRHKKSNSLFFPSRQVIYITGGWGQYHWSIPCITIMRSSESLLNHFRTNQSRSYREKVLRDLWKVCLLDTWLVKKCALLAVHSHSLLCQLPSGLSGSMIHTFNLDQHHSMILSLSANDRERLHI